MLKQFLAFFFAVGLAVANTVMAATQVRVDGLFEGAAFLNINGQQVMLRNGATGPSQVKLISATSRAAVLEVDGKRQTLKLQSAIGGNYQTSKVTEVTVRKNNRDQYMVEGSINGLPVTFMVDTGANTIAMNEGDARRLGLQYRLDGKESQVVTASGVSRSWSVMLDKVKVGEISVPNVQAVVVKGAYPTSILLGMSYLKHVKMKEHNSVLLLQRKF